jgi:inorganic pyrophosphatase
MARGRKNRNKSNGSRAEPQQNALMVQAPGTDHIPAWDEETGNLNVIVDTPKGSAIKFKYDTSKRIYKISHLLPPGTVFPYDFGSIPSTRAEDGDPLDVLILMEQPSFAGCLVPVRLIGVLEAKQTQEGKTQRNDRLIGVAVASRVFDTTHALDDLPEKRLSEIEHYFVAYNEERGRTFRPIGRFGPRRARALVQKGERQYRENQARG